MRGDGVGLIVEDQDVVLAVDREHRVAPIGDIQQQRCARYDNFVPWYLVNETTLWTAAGPTRAIRS